MSSPPEVWGLETHQHSPSCSRHRQSLKLPLQNFLSLPCKIPGSVLAFRVLASEVWGSGWMPRLLWAVCLDFPGSEVRAFTTQWATGSVGLGPYLHISRGRVRETTPSNQPLSPHTPSASEAPDLISHLNLSLCCPNSPALQTQTLASHCRNPAWVPYSRSLLPQFQEIVGTKSGNKC